MKRNLARFPEDFAFQLTKEEFDNLRSQTGISSWGGRRYAPYAFTEQGVADAEYYDPQLNPLFRGVLTEIRDDGKTVQ